MKELIVLVVSLLIFTVGCATKPPIAEPTPSPPAEIPAPKPMPQVKGNFIEGVSAGDAETLNWILAVDTASHSYAGYTLGSLATYDNQWNVVLRHLAEPVKVSEDGFVYTITIRDDLRWSDGTKITAEDSVYTLKNLMFSDWLY